MQALGLIETFGLIAAIESADVMLKSAQVELLERTFVGAGLVTIAVTGDVGAVKAAVDAGAAAAKRICNTALISQHVIARPHDEVETILRKKEAVVEVPAKPDVHVEQISLPLATEVQEVKEIVAVKEKTELIESKSNKENGKIKRKE